jgi:hypothetical protein
VAALIQCPFSVTVLLGLLAKPKGANHPLFIMNITLVHPVHGAKVATMELEVEADEKNGWTRYNPDTPVQAAPVVNTLETKRRRKPAEEAIQGV